MFAKDQLTNPLFTQDVFYTVSALCVILGILGLGFIDSGLTRRRNLWDGWIGKLVAALVSGFAYIFVGYAIWNWQFSTAFGGTLHDSLNTWWLGGTGLTHFAQDLSPKVVPEADVFQVFWVFFLTFAMFLGALLHSATLERIRPLTLYAMCFIIIAVPWSLLSYLVWGSASPLTNSGLHDYVGVFNLYIFVGVISVLLNWRLGPRSGVFDGTATIDAPTPERQSGIAAGVLLLMFAIPGIVLGSGYFVSGVGYFGISMTTSGFGIALSNTMLAFFGGGLAGALLAYRTRQAVWVFFGPITGYIACSALLDIGKPWEMLIVSLFGPLFAFGTAQVLRRLRIDDQKIGPLTLGPGLFAAIVAGFIGWHTKTGGFFGLKGDYGFQHAQITPWWQLIGVGVTVGIAAVTCLVLCAVFEAAGRLRVDDETERAGFDEVYWGQPAPASASPTDGATSTVQPARPV